MAKKRIYRYPLYLLARGVAGLICLLPRTIALWLAGHLGRLAFYVVRRHRDKALGNLRRVFGKSKSEREIAKIGEGVFENLLKTAIDTIQFSKLTPQKIKKMVDAEEAFETYRSLLAEGKGIISITAHIGNWELLAGVIIAKGFPGVVVGKRLYYEPYNRWITDLRKTVGVRTIYQEEAARDVLRALRRNEVVGILPDQDIERMKGIFVNFFEKPAHTMIAPIRFSLSTGAPILSNFLIREGAKYRLVVGKPIRPRVETTVEDAIQKYTEVWMAQFEEVIKRYPEQWAWMHDRWKTKPSSILGSDSEKEIVKNL